MNERYAMKINRNAIYYLIGLILWFGNAQSTHVFVRNYSKKDIYISSRLVKIYQIPIFDKEFYEYAIYAKSYEHKNKKNLLYIDVRIKIPLRKSEPVCVSHKALLQKHEISQNDPTKDVSKFEDICPKVFSAWELFNLKDTLPHITIDKDLKYSVDHDEKEDFFEIVVHDDDPAEILLISSEDDLDSKNDAKDIDEE